ncbi:B2 protein [Bienertia sinuspersici]
MGTGKIKPVSPRNLKPGLLGGVIFGCTDMTIKECLTKQLFGLPGQHYVYVKNIFPGLPLFLFNYSRRQLHGIFEAASQGQMNINPYGWTKDGSERTSYPAQVQIRVQNNCHPLTENQFQPIIKGNYYTHKHFRFELDHAQVSKLITLFLTQAVAPSATMPRTKGNWQIVNQYPSDPRAREEGGNDLSDACVGPTYNGSNEFLSGPSSCPDGIHQTTGNDIEALGKDEMDLIYEKLQMLAANGESLESSGEVHETTRNMHDEVDGSLEEKMGQVENFKESTLLPSDLRSIIDELSVVQQLQDRCTRLEAFSNQSETYSHGATEPSGEQHLDPNASIYLLGGSDGTSWLGSLDIYSPSKDIIKSRTNMPSLRSYTSLATLNGDLYVIGGGHMGSWYDTGIEGFHVVFPLHFPCNTANRSLFLLQVESYNTANNDWTSLPCLNERKGGLAAAKLYDKIFAIGGGNGIHCFSDVEMFDIDVGRWISARSMLQKRFDLAAVELNGVIYAVGAMMEKTICGKDGYDMYAIGGFDGSAMVPSVEVYDPRHGTWMSEAPMNHSRGYSLAVVLSDCIYAIGGMGKDANLLDKEGVGWQLTNLKAVGKRCFASAIVM